jgi:serine protease Do
MKKIFLLFLVLSATILSLSNASAGDTSTEFSQTSKDLIYDSCFEIVIPKPDKDSLTYEKPLPWDLIPFKARNDKYYSIGTAFAVSSTELLTAFHVLSLDENSLTYKNYFIRDKNQNVYELDTILLMDNDRDFVKFTVKGKTFSKWLTINNKYEINSSVFTVGNAYGEGIIIRKGDLIGTIPEDENGKWEYLKTSSDVNSGNSGGPLLNAQSQVVGIVVSRKDNISYSLPVAEVSKTLPGKGRIHNKTFYGFSLIPDKKESVKYDYEIVLPKKYKDVTKELSINGDSFYSKTMDKFFDDMKADFFPNGDNSLELLNYGINKSFPQMIYQDKNSKKWFNTDFQTESYSIEKNGKLILAKITDDLFIIDLRKPDAVSIKDIYASPKLTIDTIFKGINISRKIGNQDTRILSLGNPFITTSFKDIHNRKWNVNVFLLEYSDEAFIIFSLPTPKGQVLLTKSTSSSKLNVWLYDLKKMVNLTYVPYFGNIKEWNEFLKHTDILPEKVNAIKIKAVNGKSLNVTSSRFTIDITNDVLPINDETEITINYGVYPDKGKIVWDVRRILVAEYNKDNYLSLYKHIRPDKKLPDVFEKNWKDVLVKKHPYNITPFSEDGRTNIATVLTTKTKPAAQPLTDQDTIYTLYLGYEGTVEADKMQTLIKSLNEKISILE